MTGHPGTTTLPAVGITLPGVPKPAPVVAVNDMERAIAQNLRQRTACGKEHIRKLLEDPNPSSEAELARLIADSGGRAIRENEAWMLAQLQTTAEENTHLRRAVESAACNSRIAPANYPPELREILIHALGRPY